MKDSEKDTQIEALKDQIKFLEGLVMKMADRAPSFVYSYPVNPYYRPYWSQTTPIWGGVTQGGGVYTVSNATMTSALSKVA